MTRTRAVALVNGPWQAISLAASLRHLRPSGGLLAVLVDMNQGSRLCETTKQILSANGIADTLCIPTGTSCAQAEQRMHEVTRGALGEVELVATYGVHRPMARFLCNLASRAELLVYEDGLRAYVSDPSPAPRASRWLRAAAYLLGRRSGMAWRDPRLERGRVAHALLLTNSLEPPRQAQAGTLHRVPKEHVQHAITRARPPFAERLDRPYLLIVGQYYAALKQMSHALELERYAEAAREAERRGLTPVWRGHIRSEDPLYERLRCLCPSLRNFNELVDDPSYPLELYHPLFDARCAGAVSFSSSALFYLRELYQVPTYTLLDAAMVRRMNYPHRDGCALALAKLPQLLPAA